jgi:DNA anti-recombination protein RmuC
MRSAVLAASLTASLALAACGGDDKSTAPAASASEARTEAAATRASLQKALDELKAGDRKAADNTVSEGYLQHFEDVEGPLAKVDHELNEKLEDTIKGDLREKIKSGAPVTEVEQLIASLDADLKTAEAKLR